MQISERPIVAVHPVDHDTVKAYYQARGWIAGTHYELVPGPARWPDASPREESYDRYAGL